MPRIHVVKKSDWPRQTWVYPRIHNFNFGFGLSAEATTKAHTIVPYLMQDNALVDLETIKTNPENADFAVVGFPNCHAGSYVPKINVGWSMFIPTADTEIISIIVNTMQLGCAFLNRLDAHDKKTGDDIETILELTHETTDEQAYPLWNGTKLFEGGGTYDYDALVPGLTTDQQPEGVAFDKELFFDAMHYYTNKQMLKSVTQRMKTYMISEPIVPHGRSMVRYSRTLSVPPQCKFMNPYAFFGELFSVPQVGDLSQIMLAAETSAIEHITVKGFVRFNEYNPDFNFARA